MPAAKAAPKKTPAKQSTQKDTPTRRIKGATKPRGAPRKDVGRSRSVELRPDRDRLIQDIVEGRRTDKDIAAELGVHPQTIGRFRNGPLLERAAAALAKRREQDGDLYLQEILADEEKVRKLLDACDRWLEDPAHPGTYTLDPRADEIEVIYTRCNGNGNEVKDKDTLQNLLARVAGGIDGEVLAVKMKQADPRELILKTVDGLNRSRELRAKIEQIISDRVQVNVEKGIIVVPATQEESEWNLPT